MTNPTRLEAWQNATKAFMWIGIWMSGMTILLAWLPRFGGYNREITGAYAFLMLLFYGIMEVKIANKAKNNENPIEEQDEKEEDR